MKFFKSLQDDVYNISETTFEKVALDVFRLQAEHNEVYKGYLHYLNKDPYEIRTLEKIPFLPIDFFKHHSIKTGDWNEEVVYESSSTTGKGLSRHYIFSENWYFDMAVKGFELIYGPLKGYILLALLPSYLERSTSSLVAMVKRFMDVGGKEESGFYLNDYKELSEKLEALSGSENKVMLIGVTFALLDMLERYPQDLSHIEVMETGGMKGRREELTRGELHHILSQGLNIQTVHSEYGMTELQSQAYSKGQGVFHCPPWMRIKIRDVNDPFSTLAVGKTGGINIIDLANIHSCSFLETKDLGRLHHDASFEVLGRFDNSDLRGCNLMVQ